MEYLVVFFLILFLVLYSASIYMTTNGSDEELNLVILHIAVICLIILGALNNHNTKKLFGYPAGKISLPVYGVCEVIHQTPAIRKGENGQEQQNFITMLKLTNGRFRLISLDQALNPGLWKVRPDFKLEPFPAPDETDQKLEKTPPLALASP